jgi:hypothetical protein
MNYPQQTAGNQTRSDQISKLASEDFGRDLTSYDALRISYWLRAIKLAIQSLGESAR